MKRSWSLALPVLFHLLCGRHRVGRRLAIWSVALSWGLGLGAWTFRACAADQPQWGQAWSRNMVSDEKGLPASFDPKTGRNIKWVARLGTETHSTPIAAGGHLYVGTNNGQPRDPKHQGDRGVLMCFDEKTGGHLLVTTVIKLLGLDKYSRDFNESNDQLLFLRNRNMFLSEISPGDPAPYNIAGGGAGQSPYNGFSTVGDLAVTKKYPSTRKEWCAFNQTGKIIKSLPESFVFQKGDKAKDIGYWNLMYDQLGPEGYQYTADANGYSSNVINWNSAVAFNSNNEFTPGNQYKTLTLGYSSMFTALFAEIEKLAQEKGINFKYYPDTRLHSILDKKGVVHFTIANRDNPWQASGEKTCDAAWLAMPRNAIDLVAEATRYQPHDGLDVLNDRQVTLYLEAAIMQPSYKIGLFFDQPWWNKATYSPRLTSLTVTDDVLKQLAALKWPSAYLKKMKAAPSVYNVVFSSADAIIAAVQASIDATLDAAQLGELLTTTKGLDSIGPSFTDTPVRMAVYFGNNALNQSGEKVYGFLKAGRVDSRGDSGRAKRRSADGWLHERRGPRGDTRDRLAAARKLASDGQSWQARRSAFVRSDSG